MSCGGLCRGMKHKVLTKLPLPDSPAGAHPSGRIGEDPQGKPNNLLPLLAAYAVGRNFGGLKVFGNDFPTIDGTCVRDYLHVVDLATGHVSAIDALLEGKIYEQTGEAGHYRAFNLGTGKALSVLQMIEAMRTATGFDYQYEIVGRRLVHYACDARHVRVGSAC